MDTNFNAAMCLFQGDFGKNWEEHLQTLKKHEYVGGYGIPYWELDRKHKLTKRIHTEMQIFDQYGKVIFETEKNRNTLIFRNVICEGEKTAIIFRVKERGAYSMEAYSVLPEITLWSRFERLPLLKVHHPKYQFGKMIELKVYEEDLHAVVWCNYMQIMEIFKVFE
jgi:hypothetical protein